MATVDGGAETYGVSTSPDRNHILYTDRLVDATGYNVITVDDAETTFTLLPPTPMTLGTIFDSFDVNDPAGVVVTPDGTLGFASAFNRYVPDDDSHDPDIGNFKAPGYQPAGGNIGIIVDPLGLNGGPKLVAATRMIPLSFLSELVLSNDGKYLYAAYRGSSAVFIFDVNEIRQTVNNTPAATLMKLPVDDLNPAIYARANFQLARQPNGLPALDAGGNPFFQIPPGATNGPIGTTGLPGGLSIMPSAMPPVCSANLADHFFVNDAGSFTLDFANNTPLLGDDPFSKLVFVKTLADGPNFASNKLKLAFVGPVDAQLNAFATTANTDFKFNKVTATDYELVFDPSHLPAFGSVELRQDTAAIVDPGPAANKIGQITLHGTAIPQQQILFPFAGFRDSIKVLVDRDPTQKFNVNGTDKTITKFVGAVPADSADPGDLRSDEPGFLPLVQTLYDSIKAQALAVYALLNPGGINPIVFLDSATGVGIPFVFDTPLINGTTPLTPSSAAGNSVDFEKTKFLADVATSSRTSVLQEEFRFANEINNSYSDPAVGPGFPPFGGLVFNMDYQAARIAPSALAVTDVFPIRVANAMVHELGHLIGMMHMRGPTDTKADEYVWGDGDVMGDANTSLTSVATFHTLAGAAKLALGTGPTDAEWTAAYTHYSTLISLEHYAFREEGVPLEDRDPATIAGVLSVYDRPVTLNGSSPVRVASVALPRTIAGGSATTATVYLFNDGGQPLTIDSIELLGAPAGVTIQKLQAIQLPRVLPAIDIDNPDPTAATFALTLSFDPATVGNFTGSLRIVSTGASQSIITIPITAATIAAVPAASIDMHVANLGAFGIGSTPRIADNFATITNTGGAPLHIYLVRNQENSNEFALAGLPFFGPANPLTIAAGQSLDFDLAWAAAKPGLQRGTFQIVTDDLANPLLTFHVVATGISDLLSQAQIANNAIALVDPFTGQLLARTKADAAGNFALDVPPDKPFEIIYFDPASGLVSHQCGTASSQGEVTDLPLPSYTGSTAPDTDNDGLPDDIELAIGTNLNDTDTNDDGIDDFVAIQTGGEPILHNFDNPSAGVTGTTSPLVVSPPTASPIPALAPNPVPVAVPADDKPAAGSTPKTSSGVSVQADPVPSLVNGNFSVSDPAATGFGWNARGNTFVDAAGRAVLGEGGTLVAGLSQTFTLPAGARHLRFTLSSAAFLANPSGPPDAFEVALLDAVSLAPVAGVAPAFAGSDALLNIQASGQASFAAGILLDGKAPGGTISLQQPHLVDIDLFGIAAGSQLTVYFDMLGFGADGSSVTIDDVQVIGDALPDTTPPQLLLPAIINDGLIQHSSIFKVQFSFSENVATSLDLADLQLIRVGSGPVSLAGGSISLDADGKVATLVLSGVAMPDGDYQLRILPDSITDPAGNSLDVDGDGIGDRGTGRFAAVGFFKLAGDADASSQVDALDMLVVRKSLGFTSGDPGFDANADLDGNATVNTDDLDIIVANLTHARDGSQGPTSVVSPFAVSDTPHPSPVAPPRSDVTASAFANSRPISLPPATAPSIVTGVPPSVAKHAAPLKAKPKPKVKPKAKPKPQPRHPAHVTKARAQLFNHQRPIKRPAAHV